MCLYCNHFQGKYLAKDGGPRDARLNKYRGRYAEAESRYGPRPNVIAAVQAYVRLAKDWGITPTSLALRSVNTATLPMICKINVGMSAASRHCWLLFADLCFHIPW